MSGGIQAKFEVYQNKFPLYSRNAIVDLMLKDGAITPEVAEKIKSGVSLFMLDNDFKNQTPQSLGFDTTTIFGGEFSTKKASDSVMHTHTHTHTHMRASMNSLIWLKLEMTDRFLVPSLL